MDLKKIAVTGLIALIVLAIAVPASAQYGPGSSCGLFGPYGIYGPFGMFGCLPSSPPIPASPLGLYTGTGIAGPWSFGGSGTSIGGFGSSIGGFGTSIGGFGGPIGISKLG